MKNMIQRCLLVLSMMTTFSHAGADEAKMAFDTQTAQTKKLFKNWESSLFFKTLSVETIEYKAEADHATATQVYRFVLNPNKKQKKARTNTVTVNYGISYAVPDKKAVVARIKTTAIKYESTNSKNKAEKSFDPTKDSQTIDIYDNGDVHCHIISSGEDEATTVVNWRGQLKTINKLYGQFDITQNNKAESSHNSEANSDSASDKVGLKGEYNAEKGLTISTIAPARSTKDGITTDIAMMSFNAKFNDVDGIAHSLPSFSWTTNDISVTSQSRPKIEMKTLKFGFSTTQNAKGYIDMLAQLKVQPKGDWVNTLSQGKFDFSNFEANISIDNIPKNLANSMVSSFMNAIEKGYSGENDQIGQEIQQMTQKHSEAWFNAVQKSGFGSKLAIKLDTDRGNGFLNLGLHFKDTGLTLDSIAGKKPSVDTLTDLLDFSGKSSLPATLVEATGMQIFLMMAFQKKDDAYVSNIETKEGKVLVNGVPFNLAPFLSK